MIPVLIACLAITSTGMCEAPEPPTEWWWASQYAESVFDRVVATRQAGRTAKDLPMLLPDVDGFIAVADCDQIGDVWTLRPAGQVQWETFLVADCSGHAATTEWMTRNEIICEIDYEAASRWNTVGQGIRIEVGILEEQNKLPRAEEGW